MNQPTDSASDQPAEEDEEFTPVGTMALLGVYFAILTLLWFFMYFVEFLGRGPTVIG